MSPPDLAVRAVGRAGAELDELVAEWDALARRRGLGFASRPSYALSWWEELGRGRLEIVTARRDGRLVAVAPLHRRSVLGKPVLRWLGHGLGGVGELVADDAPAATAVWSWLADRGTPLQLTHLRLDDVGTLALRRAGRLDVRLDVDGRCHVLDLAPGSSSSDVRAATELPRPVTAPGARAGDAEGPVALDLVTDVDGLRRAWPELVRLAAGALPGPGHAGFAHRFLEQEARAGALVLAGAAVGDRWVGHLTLLRCGRSLSLWDLRPDPAPGRAGIGDLIVEKLVDRHEELGFDRLDLGVGESAVRCTWSTTAYDVGTAVAAPRRAGVVQARLDAARRAGTAAQRLRVGAGVATGRVR